VEKSAHPAVMTASQTQMYLLTYFLYFTYLLT